jgi:hypothetical protein
MEAGNLRDLQTRSQGTTIVGVKVYDICQNGGLQHLAACTYVRSTQKQQNILLHTSLPRLQLQERPCVPSSQPAALFHGLALA